MDRIESFLIFTVMIILALLGWSWIELKEGNIIVINASNAMMLILDRIESRYGLRFRRPGDQVDLG